LLNASIDQRLGGRGDCAAGRVHIVDKQHRRTRYQGSPRHFESSLDRLRSIVCVHARAMPLGRFDPCQRPIVKSQIESSRNQRGDDCRLIESALFLSKAM
jgi:hypothetical protein